MALNPTTLSLPKSEGAPFLHISLDRRPFDEYWQPFLGGLFQAPIPVYYNAPYELADTILAICGNSAKNGCPRLPISVKDSMAELMNINGINSFDFFWIVTDVSQLIERCGNEPNLSNHAWYFPDDLFPEVVAGRRVEVDLDAGIFTYKGSQVSVLLK